MSHYHQGYQGYQGLEADTDRTAAMGALAAAVVDEIECGLVVCDSHGHIGFANQAAQRELGSARVIVRNGNSVQRLPQASGELDTAIRQAAERGKRSLVRLACSGDRLMVSVLPLQQPDNDTRHVLLVMGRRQPCSDLGLEMLASTYGLTLAERRVLSGLVREATPREIATENAVALCTVRTQILALRSKLGTRNIEGLLLRAAEVPPVASALRMAVGVRQVGAGAVGAWRAAA